MASTGKGDKSTPQHDARYVYPMAVVERLTGLTPRRIRYYEKYGLVQPSRTAGNHRLYSPANVETLIRVRDIMRSGITNMEAVARIMDLGFDKAGSPPSSPSSWGDAAFRVMRPVSSPLPGSGKQPETDSSSYFRRVKILAEGDRKHNP